MFNRGFVWSLCRFSCLLFVSFFFCQNKDENKFLKRFVIETNVPVRIICVKFKFLNNWIDFNYVYNIFINKYEFMYTEKKSILIDINKSFVERVVQQGHWLLGRLLEGNLNILIQYKVHNCR